jgi:hypothetical protein
MLAMPISGQKAGFPLFCTRGFLAFDSCAGELGAVDIDMRFPWLIRRHTQPDSSSGSLGIQVIA